MKKLLFISTLLIGSISLGQDYELELVGKTITDKTEKLVVEEIPYQLEKVPLQRTNIPKKNQQIVKQKQKTRSETIQIDKSLHPSRFHLKPKKEIEYKAISLVETYSIQAKEFLYTDNSLKNAVYANARNNFIFKSSTAIAEDKHKNIWIASREEGIVKYNGFSYTLYGNLPNNFSNNINNLLYDSIKDELYAFTDVGFFKIKNDSLFIPNLDGLNSKIDVFSAYQLKDKSILFGTKEHGLFRVIDNDFQHWDITDGIPKNNIWAIFEDNESNLWLSFQNHGIFKISSNTSKKIMFLNQNNELKFATSMFIDKQKAYFGCFQNGMICIEGKDTSMISTSENFKSSIYSIIPYKSKIAYVNYNSSLVILDGEKFDIYNTQNGLQEGYYYKAFCDSYNNIWIGSLGSEIFRVNPEYFYFDDYLPKPFKNISGIEKNSQNEKMLFSFQGPILIDKGDYFESIETLDRWKRKRIFYISNYKKNDDGSFWISNYNQYPEKIDENYNYKYVFKGEKWKPNTFVDFVADKHQRNWFVNNELGLVFEEGKRFFLVDKSNGLYANNNYRTKLDLDGNPMLIFPECIQIIKKNTIETISFESQIITPNQIAAICRDSVRQQLILATKEGNLFVLKDEKIFQLKNFNTVLGKIHLMKFYEEFFLIFTNKGIVQMKITADNQFNYVDFYGTNYFDFFHTAKHNVLVTEDKNLLWTNEHALLHINKNLFKSKKPQLYFKVLTINQKPIQKINKNYTLDSIHFLVDFKYWGYKKDIQVIANIYEADEIIATYPFNNKRLDFQGLKKGNYEISFHVNNAIGIPIYKSPKITLQVLPRWFETNLFKLLVFIVVVGLIISYVRYREKTQRKRKEALEKMIRIKTKELVDEQQRLVMRNKTIEEQNEQKDALIQEIHHRVKNNLQLICILIEMQLNSKNTEKALSETLRRIESMAIIHEMLYEQENLNQISCESYIKPLIEYCLELYQNEQTNIQVVQQIENVKLDVSKSIALGMICSELFSNSFKHANTNSIVISASLKIEDKFVVFEFSDNGTNNKNTENDTNLGSKLLHIFSKQLKANLNLDRNEGYKYIISFKNE